MFMRRIGCSLLVSLCSAAFTQAQGMHDRRDSRRERSAHNFELGVCVGQTLAMQSPAIVLTPGQAMTTDDRDSIQAAILACQTQMDALNGNPAQQGPTNPPNGTTPVTPPNGTPTPVTPVPSPTPTPSA